MQNSHFVTASSSHLDSISSGQNQVTSQNHVKSVLKLINSEDINYNDFSESDTISVAVRLNSTGNSTMQNMSTLATGSNSTAEEQTGDENPLMGYVLQIMVGLHLVVFVSGLVGNTLVCMSVYRNKSLRTVTNYFIVNLAVADFLVILICLPPTVYWDVYLTWSFGLASCKLVTYLQTVTVCVSVLNLTAISMDRWYAICRPLQFSSSKHRAKIIIALIWFVSMLIALPEAIYSTTIILYEDEHNIYMNCTYSWPNSHTTIYQLCIVFITFVLPFILMTISYSHIVNVLWRNTNDAIQSNEDKSRDVIDEPTRQHRLNTRASNSNNHTTLVQGVEQATASTQMGSYFDACGGCSSSKSPAKDDSRNHHLTIDKSIDCDDIRRKFSLNVTNSCQNNSLASVQALGYKIAQPLTRIDGPGQASSMLKQNGCSRVKLSEKRADSFNSRLTQRIDVNIQAKHEGARTRRRRRRFQANRNYNYANRFPTTNQTSSTCSERLDLIGIVVDEHEKLFAKCNLQRCQLSKSLGNVNQSEANDLDIDRSNEGETIEVVAAEGDRAFYNEISGQNAQLRLNPLYAPIRNKLPLKITKKKQNCKPKSQAKTNGDASSRNVAEPIGLTGYKITEQTSEQEKQVINTRDKLRRCNCRVSIVVHENQTSLKSKQKGENQQKDSVSDETSFIVLCLSDELKRREQSRSLTGNLLIEKMSDSKFAKLTPCFSTSCSLDQQRTNTRANLPTQSEQRTNKTHESYAGKTPTRVRNSNPDREVWNGETNLRPHYDTRILKREKDMEEADWRWTTIKVIGGVEREGAIWWTAKQKPANETSGQDLQSSKLNGPNFGHLTSSEQKPYPLMSLPLENSNVTLENRLQSAGTRHKNGSVWNWHVPVSSLLVISQQNHQHLKAPESSRVQFGVVCEKPAANIVIVVKFHCDIDANGGVLAAPMGKDNCDWDWDCECNCTCNGVWLELECASCSSGERLLNCGCRCGCGRRVELAAIKGRICEPVESDAAGSGLRDAFKCTNEPKAECSCCTIITANELRPTSVATAAEALPDQLTQMRIRNNNTRLLEPQIDGQDERKNKSFERQNTHSEQAEGYKNGFIFQSLPSKRINLGCENCKTDGSLQHLVSCNQKHRMSSVTRKKCKKFGRQGQELAAKVAPGCCKLAASDASSGQQPHLCGLNDDGSSLLRDIDAFNSLQQQPQQKLSANSLSADSLELASQVSRDTQNYDDHFIMKNDCCFRSGVYINHCDHNENDSNSCQFAVSRAEEFNYWQEGSRMFVSGQGESGLCINKVGIRRRSLESVELANERSNGNRIKEKLTSQWNSLPLAICPCQQPRHFPATFYNWSACRNRSIQSETIYFGLSKRLKIVARGRICIGYELANENCAPICRDFVNLSVVRKINEVAIDQPPLLEPVPSSAPNCILVGSARASSLKIEPDNCKKCCKWMQNKQREINRRSKRIMVQKQNKQLSHRPKLEPSSPSEFHRMKQKNIGQQHSSKTTPTKSKSKTSTTTRSLRATSTATTIQMPSSVDVSPSDEKADASALANATSNQNRFCKLIESRRKAAKMLIVIVIMFGLCFLPVHFLNLLRCTIGLPQNDFTLMASLLSHWLCYFNSAINPLIYNLMSGKFRHEFANLFTCNCWRKKKQIVKCRQMRRDSNLRSNMHKNYIQAS